MGYIKNRVSEVGNLQADDRERRITIRGPAIANLQSPKLKEKYGESVGKEMTETLSFIKRTKT
jgi:hypothetical protein